ncbi:MAG: DNA-directed RNA polymerase subunit P [Candidatus Pacearchaeota archaeon]
MQYKCFKCGKKVEQEELQKRMTCPECGSKIFHKERTKVRRIKAE